jgi:hypothetical protein
MAETMVPTEIAERFGVSPGNIGNIIHRRAWAWLKDEEIERKLK